MSCSAHNIGQINLIFYENVSGTNCQILRNEPHSSFRNRKLARSLTILVKLSKNFMGLFWVPMVAFKEVNLISSSASGFRNRK